MPEIQAGKGNIGNIPTQKSTKKQTEIVTIHTFIVTNTSQTTRILLHPNTLKPNRQAIPLQSND